MIRATPADSAILDLIFQLRRRNIPDKVFRFCGAIKAGFMIIRSTSSSNKYFNIKILQTVKYGSIKCCK